MQARSIARGAQSIRWACDAHLVLENRGRLPATDSRGRRSSPPDNARPVAFQHARESGTIFGPPAFDALREFFKCGRLCTPFFLECIERVLYFRSGRLQVRDPELIAQPESHN